MSSYGDSIVSWLGRSAVFISRPSAAQREAGEVVEDEHARGARHDRRVDGASHARRAALGRKTEVAARETDDHAEDHALHEAGRDVAEAEQAGGEAVVERGRADAEERLAGVRGAEER